MYNIFLAINAHPTPLPYVIGCIWSELSCLLLVRAAGPCFPLAGGISKFYASIFNHWPIRRCLVLSKKTSAASLSTFVNI
jgi:hypothetical protein